MTSFGIKDSVIEEIIKYIYTGRMKISIGTVEDILSASSFLMFPSLRKACCTFLEDILSPTNSLSIAKLASKFGCDNLLYRARSLIQEEFAMVVEGDEFLNLEPEALFEILNDPCIEVTSEDAVFKGLMRWLEEDMISKAKHFPHLLRSIRIQFLDDKYFSSLQLAVSQCPGFKTCETLVEEAVQARQLQQINANDLLQVGDHMKPRASLDVADVVVAFGGYDGNHCLSLVYAFSLASNEWGYCLPMLVSRHDHMVAVMDNHVYVLGGFNSRHGPLNDVEAYNPVRNKWVKIAPMNSKRKSLGVAVFNNYLYACGGLDDSYNSLNTVEYYDKESKQWLFTSSMNEARYSHNVVASEDAMFAIGGWKKSTVEKFQEGQWEGVASLQNCRAGASAVYRNGKIYVIGGYGVSVCLSSMEIYDIELDYWTSGVPSNLARWRAGWASTGNEVYIVGGRNSSWQYLDVVESYNFETKQWKEEPSLPCGTMGLRCAFVKMPKCKIKFSR